MRRTDKQQWEPGAVLRLVLVATGLLPAGATLPGRDSSRSLTRRFAEDPLLKVGAGAMILRCGLRYRGGLRRLPRPADRACSRETGGEVRHRATRPLKPRRRPVGREGHTAAQVPGNTPTSPPTGVT